jgi:ribosomal protein L35AE/L33A
MKRLLLISVILAAMLLSACATASETQQPSLSSQDAVAIAKEHSVTSPSSREEAIVGRYVQIGVTQVWNATYSGKGKWTVVLRLHNQDGSITIHRWSVFETNLAAVYLGGY